MKDTLKLNLIVLSIFMQLCMGCESGHSKTEIVNTLCEYMDNPIGIDSEHPRFTWQFSNGQQNFIQKAWQIKIASKPELLTTGEADIWMSDKTENSVPRAEYYGENPLTPFTRYYWDVTVWDNKGNTITSPVQKFETGNTPASGRKTPVSSFSPTVPTQAGRFSCSSQQLNKIYQTAIQDYLDNMQHFFADYPKNDKGNWAAGTHTAMDFALLNFNGITFYEKWVNDFMNRTHKYNDFPRPVWNTVLFTIPNTLYNYYGETRSIELLYPAIVDYLAYLNIKEKDELPTVDPDDYTAALYDYLNYKLMARFTSILGKEPDLFLKKAKELKRIINSTFFHPENATYADGTQTSQAIALYMGIVPKEKEQQAADRLHEIVTENNYYPDFDLTVPAMLTKYGYVEDACKIITQAANISASQPFMRDVSAWMCNILAGINYERTKPGFEHIIIKPHFIEDLEWVKSEYNSVRGPIQVEWKKSSNKTELSVNIPAGSTATIYADKEYSVGSGIHKYNWKTN